MTVQPLPATTHIGQVHLQVRDLERALAFYAGLLGFPIKRRAENTAVLSADIQGPELISLTARRDAVVKPPRTTGLYHVAIRFPSRAALGRELGRLIERRWPIQGAADHLVSEALYLADPDGNGLELYVDRPRDSWPRQAGQITMRSDPLDLQDLLAACAEQLAGAEDLARTAEQVGEGEPGTAGIDPLTDVGHIHLQVSDLGQAEAFYCDLLGFEVTQRSYPGALFVSAGGYHHHLGLNTWAGRGASRPAENAVGLVSFRVEIPDAEARTGVIERARRAGVIANGRTPEDHTGNRFQLSDPDGNRIEI